MAQKPRSSDCQREDELIRKCPSISLGERNPSLSKVSQHFPIRFTSFHISSRLFHISSHLLFPNTSRHFPIRFTSFHISSCLFHPTVHAQTSGLVVSAGSTPASRLWFCSVTGFCLFTEHIPHWPLPVVDSSPMAFAFRRQPYQFSITNCNNRRQQMSNLKRYGVIVGRSRVMSVYAADAAEAKRKARQQLNKPGRYRIYRRWKNEGQRVKELGQ